MLTQRFVWLQDLEPNRAPPALLHNLSSPSPRPDLAPLTSSLQVCNPDEMLHFLSNYLTEISLVEYKMLNFLPSVIAAAGVYLANLMLKRQPWDANLRCAQI